ncbi:boophilin-H2-like [Asterias rubens]|uniref:boophilin-H2-like n=1 Tax=Asterias rubens TaxID=7604 RepID=UPI0014550722|nr:boophilin-H2-like [Asterias rubens]
MATYVILGVMVMVMCVNGGSDRYVKDKCEAKLDHGPCRGRMPSWGYDTELEQCRGFIYGGCGGNPNNFLTEEECIEMCEHPRSCFDEEDNMWYYHQESTNGGAGCGGCTCNDGLFECSSCNLIPLVCAKINCEDKCRYGSKIDEMGCETCDCKPEPGHLESFSFYCKEVCNFCRVNTKVKCPPQCSCYNKI